MRLSSSREIADKAKELLREGWTLLRGRKHTRIRAPNGCAVTIPGTPSGGRAVQNFLSDVKRAARGFDPRQHRRQHGHVLCLYVTLPATVAAMLLAFGIALGAFVEFVL